MNRAMTIKEVAAFQFQQLVANEGYTQAQAILLVLEYLHSSEILDAMDICKELVNLED